MVWKSFLILLLDSDFWWLYSCNELFSHVQCFCLFFQLWQFFSVAQFFYFGFISGLFMFLFLGILRINFGDICFCSTLRKMFCWKLTNHFQTDNKYISIALKFFLPSLFFFFEWKSFFSLNKTSKSCKLSLKEPLMNCSISETVDFHSLFRTVISCLLFLAQHVSQYILLVF